MSKTRKLELKIDRKKVAIIEEDFLTRKLLSTTINSYFEDLESWSYDSFTEFNKSVKAVHQQKICSVFLSLKSFYCLQSHFSPEVLDFLKNTPAIIMAHSFSSNDLSLLNQFFIEEPIILKKPVLVKDVINLTEWTTLRSNERNKEFSNGYKDHENKDNGAVLH